MADIVFTGGGTAGHCTPNLALVPYLKGIFDEVYYIGSENGVERGLAESRGIPYYPIGTVKLIRKFTWKNLAIPWKLFRAVSQAKKILKNLAPSVVFSKGGYVSLPVAIAAKDLGIPVITHESDYSLGLANKIAARFSDIVLTSFEDTAKSLPNARYTGTPLRQELFLPFDRKKVLEKYGLEGKLPLLLVTGGSSGSETLNRTVEKSLKEILKIFEVVHLYGKGKTCAREEKGYHPFPFADHIEELLSVTDYALSRAGANTLFELCAKSVPTLAVPLPKTESRGDQIENAKYFGDNRLIDVLYEGNLNERTLVSSLKKLIADGNELKANCRKKQLHRANPIIVKYLSVFAKKDDHGQK